MMVSEVPRVTVIIPCYNGSDLLRRAAQSVLVQTERNLELLIVDDCSLDDTFQVAQDIAASDRRTRVLRMDRNRGKPTAMNQATAEARGTWVAVLDHDDWFAPERLSVLIAAAELAGADLAADTYYDVDAKANVRMRAPLPKRETDILVDIETYLEVSDPTAKADYGMLKPVIRREFLTKHNIEYYPPAFVGEDFYFLLECLTAGGRLILVKQGLYYYTEPFGTISREWSAGRRQAYSYDLYLSVHDHYANLLQNRLGKTLSPLLARRRRGITAMRSFGSLRAAVSVRRYGHAVGIAANASSSLWMMVAKRLLSRFRPHGSDAEPLVPIL